MTASPTLDQLRRCSVAVDIGAARTRVYVRNVGLVVDEPSVAARRRPHRRAHRRRRPRPSRWPDARPSHIRVVRPVSSGAVVDIEMAQRMLRHVLGDKLGRPGGAGCRSLRAAVCMPHGSEPIARRAAIETMYGLGARRVELVDTLIAAAVGCGLPVEHPEATMIVVCGAGTTQVAVLSLGSIVAAETVPVGGDAIDQAVVQHLRNAHELMLPSQSVRPLHQVLGAPGAGGTGDHRGARPGRGERAWPARSSSRPRAYATPCARRSPPYVDAITTVLRVCPPDLVADLADRGIMLAGGSALMPGLDLMLRQATVCPSTWPTAPTSVAVQGLGAMIEGKVRPLALAPLSV